MSGLPDNNRDEARRWLANVRDDLHALDAVLADDHSPSRIACFLAHLATEKALKAVLIQAGVPFRKIHDVVELHAMCVAAGRLSNVDVAGLEDLNPWAIDGRYADDLVDATKSEAHRLADLARAVVDAATAAIG